MMSFPLRRKRSKMANIITTIRIICSIALIFCPALSPLFYAFYVTAGLTDMIDGAVARKTNTVSEFGAKLAVCLIKLIPILDLELWVYIWIAVIALIKVINIVSGLVIRKKFVTVHTVMNKATGTLLFVLPMTLGFVDLKVSAPVVCAVATFAAVQEGHYIRNGIGK